MSHTPNADVAATAANALAALIPASTPLTATPTTAPGPKADATAVAATYVGAVSAEMYLVTDDAVQDALTGTGLTLADALRPALEAATGALGAGVLGDANTLPAGKLLTGDGTHLFALNDAAGSTRGWFAVRLRDAETASVNTSVIDRSKFTVLYDVEMTLAAEIGRTKLPVRQVLDLVPGSVIELDRAAGAPADIMVNGRLIARGEVVVVDEDYAVRITEIVSPEAAA